MPQLARNVDRWGGDGLELSEGPILEKQTPEDYAEYLAWKQQRETGGAADPTRPQNPNHAATLRATGTPGRVPVGGWTTFDHFKAALGDEHARRVLGIRMNQALADQILSSETNAWAYYSGWRADQPTEQQVGARVSPPVGEQAAWAAARADLALRPTGTGTPGRPPIRGETTFDQFKASLGDEQARHVLGIKMNQALADQILSSETSAWAYYSGWCADQPPVGEPAAGAAARADLALRSTAPIDHGRTVGATPASAPAKKQDRFKSFKFGFGFAALVLLSLVSSGAQFVAASTFGIAEYVRLERSTGGLIAFITGIVMWAKCRSWESWRKWIWLPILITVTLVFISMGFTAQSIAREEAAILQEQELREEEVRLAEIAQACGALSQQIDVKAGEIERSRSESVVKRPSWATSDRPSWATSERPSWATAPTSGADEVAVMEMRAEYDASC